MTTGNHGRRALAAGALAAALRPDAACAQGVRALRLVVPFAAGGGSDNVARIIAGPIGAALGRAVLVDNRPGAGGSIGAAEVARAAPDGDTLLLDAYSHLLVPILMPRPPVVYETAFTPISLVALLPQLVVVRAASPDRTLAELLARARARPGALVFAVPGNGTQQHLAGAALFRRAGVDVLGVPYRGAAAAVQAVLSGEADLAINLSVALPMVRDGALRALAVTSAGQLPALPNVPTVAEAGFPGFDMSEWSGIWGPAGLPEPMIVRLHAAVAAAVGNEGVSARLGGLGAVPVGSAPKAFAVAIARQRAVAREVVGAAGITLD
jgi:tripartite-type tricarboxylate transporter receptor subunit TctC